MKSKKEPILYLTKEVGERLRCYTEEAPKNCEISGLGEIEVDKDNDLICEEVYLLEQEVSTISTDIEDEVYHKFYSKMIEEGKDLNKIKLWWHSHAEMSVHFSKTDEETMEEWPGDFLVSLVINKKGEMKGNITIKEPIYMSKDVQVSILRPVYHGMEEVRKEIEEKVTKKKPKKTKKTAKSVYQQHKERVEEEKTKQIGPSHMYMGWEIEDDIENDEELIEYYYLIDDLEEGKLSELEKKKLRELEKKIFGDNISTYDGVIESIDDGE